jgi:putative acetyltransferase
LHVVDLASEAAAVSVPYRNQVITRVNGSCLRLAVLNDVFRWHHHPTSDELFLVVEGMLAIDLEGGKELRLGPWQAVTIPAGTIHRTRAIGRTVNLCFEELAADTVFVDVPHRQPDAAKAARDRRLAVISPGDFEDSRVRALLIRHLEGMHAHSPVGHVFALDVSGLQKPEVTVYALWDGEELLGFGALKELDAKTGEIKSMRTADAHLRQGVGQAILDAILAEARKRGYTRLSLETGSGPAFEPAQALYRKLGFTNGSAFGGYQASSFNQFMHLDLI